MARKLIAVLGFLLFYHLFFFDHFFLSLIPGSLGFAVFISFFWAFLLFVFWKKNFLKIFSEATLLSFCSLVLAWLGVFRGDRTFAGFILWFGSLGCLFFSLCLFVLQEPKIKSVIDLFLLPIILAKSFFEYLFSERITNKKDTLAKNIPFVRGFIFAVPILAIILLLLTSADPVFERIFENTFSFLADFPVFARRVAVTLFWIFFLVPVINIVVEKDSLPRIIFKKIGTFAKDTLVVIGLVVFLLGWFLIVQFKYLFVNVSESRLSQFGINTYSEYVTKGFGELLLASFFVYLIVGLSLYIYQFSEGRSRFWIRNFNLMAIGEIFLLLLSVLRRLMLYQSYHGLTVARIYGMIFLVWLSMMLMSLVGRHFRQIKWVMFDIGVTVLIFMVVGFINVEKIIVQDFPPTVNNQVDEVYLSLLSADGYLGWKKSYTWAKNVYESLKNNQKITAEDNRKLLYARQIAFYLEVNSDNLSNFYEKTGRLNSFNWYRFNYGEWKTCNLMKKEIPHQEIINLVNGLEEIFSRVDEATKNSTLIDRASGRFLN